MPDETEAAIEEWKTQVSNDTGIPANVLRGSDLDDIQAHAASLKALLPPPTPAAGYVPSEGRTVAKAAPNPAQHFAAFLNQQLNPPTR